MTTTTSRNDVVMFMQVIPGSEHFGDLDQMLNFINGYRNYPNFADMLISRIRQTQVQGYKLKKKKSKL